GFEHAIGDILITLDSDGQHNPEEIPQLIKPIIRNKADIVIGSRFLGNCHYKMPLYARAGAYFVNLFLWLLFLQKVYDNQCGFRAFKKDIVKIFKNMKQTGMGFSTELLFKAAYFKLKVTEIPVSINSRSFGTSYVNLIKITISISSCIMFYILKKLKVNLKSSLIKKFIDFFYKRFRIAKIFNI
ncbi:MAG: glycosyltransferase family 2 protein, partial [Candidatus Hermodarchaeota archaeon]